MTSTFNTMVTHFFQMLVTMYETTRRHNLEVHILHTALKISNFNYKETGFLLSLFTACKGYEVSQIM